MAAGSGAVLISPAFLSAPFPPGKGEHFSPPRSPLPSLSNSMKARPVPAGAPARPCAWGRTRPPSQGAAGNLCIFIGLRACRPGIYVKRRGLYHRPSRVCGTEAMRRWSAAMGPAAPGRAKHQAARGGAGRIRIERRRVIPGRAAGGKGNGLRGAGRRPEGGSSESGNGCWPWLRKLFGTNGGAGSGS